VADYLNQYKNIPTQNDVALSTHSAHSEAFFNYLLSQCWQKMYRHISTFPALSFAYGLVTHWSTFKVNIRQFSWEDSEFAQSGPGDNTLASCIKSNRDYLILLEKAFGTGAPQEYQSFLEDQEHFIDLLSTANLAVDSAAPLYTKDSAKSFHRFLFATLTLLCMHVPSTHCVTAPRRN
jgi:hypothetical protein